MEYILEENYPDRMEEIELLFQAMAGFSYPVFEHALLGRPGIVSFYAYSDSRLVGCKIGFSPRPLYFESWVGGVLPECRKNGVATELTKLQHDWCRNKGYRYIETIVANDNLPMQFVNLKNGMKIVGTHLDKGNELKLRFQKTL